MTQNLTPLDLILLNKWKEGGAMTKFTLSKLGINGPKLKTMIKYEIIVEVADPLTGLPVYRVSDDLPG